MDNALQNGSAGLAWFQLLKQSWLKVSQEYIQGSRFFQTASTKCRGSHSPCRWLYGKHAVIADGVLEGLFLYVVLRLHQSGFYESCFCGKQTFPLPIHYSRNHNKHPEWVHPHKVFLISLLFFFSFFLLKTASYAWGVSNGLSVALMLSSIWNNWHLDQLPFDMGGTTSWGAGGMINCDKRPAIPQTRFTRFPGPFWGMWFSWLYILLNGQVFAACTAYSCCAGLILRRIQVRNGEMFEWKSQCTAVLGKSK